MTPGSSAQAVDLFCSPEYLQALLDSGCVAADKGWKPVELAPGAPCYEKAHSWGEFVFDHAFANAYEQRGQDYYPKLVSCVPFTPVPGPRLRSAANAQRMLELMHERRCSSAHALFLLADEAAMLERDGWLRREQPRYVWHNADYGGFDDFTARLNSKRRKNIRHERRDLADAALRIEWRAGNTLSPAEWPRVFALYAGTYAMRGQPPYLNRDCLQRWAASFGERMQFCLAWQGDELSAMAFYFLDGDTLYGRHWGSATDLPGLHFELCVYQGIEYAIRHRLKRFDAGVQGEHKLLRGFTPELSLSMHWFAHAGFREAIADYLRRERKLVERELGQLADHAGYRQATP